MSAADYFRKRMGRSREATPPRTRSAAGFSLVELIVVVAITGILATVAVPIARYQVKSAHERELRRDLLNMRRAIDSYKDAAEKGAFTTKVDSFNYPPDLDTLVSGVDASSGTGGETVKMQFLRKIPTDPMTGQADWQIRSTADDPDSSSGDGENVFDIHSKSDKIAIDGTRYSTW